MNKIKKLKLSLASSLLSFGLLVLSSSSAVKADDTEVLVTEGRAANVLFIFDLSGSMMWTTDECVDPDNDMSPCFPDPSLGEKSRYQIMMESLTSVLSDLKDQSNLRIGLSLYGDDHSQVNNDFDTTNATGIRWPIREIGEDANLTDSNITAGAYETHEIILKQLADYGEISGQYDNKYFAQLFHTIPSGVLALKNPGGTAIVDSLYEAGLYFRGEKVSDGSGGVEPSVWNGSTYSGGKSYSAHPQSYTPTNAWIPASGSRWRPTPAYFDTNTTYNSPITNKCDSNYIILLSDGTPTVNNSVSKIERMINSSCSNPTGINSAEGKCGPELAHFLATIDQQAGQGITPSVITTHTIGFSVEGVGKSYLQALASQGGGDFYAANDTTTLKNSLTALLATIASENETFTGLATSINASSLSSGNRIFMNMFKPSAKRSWLGNTKGYFIDPTKGLVDIYENEAIDTNTGKFKKTTQSFWSPIQDGNDVDKGGLSGKLSPSTRDIYSYTGTSLPINSALTKKLELNDASFPPSWFNVASTSEKDTLITQLRQSPMGDTLHANTVSITYPNKKVLFTMTNQGLLHAFDVSTPTAASDLSGGEELYAFIPQSLLYNLKDHMASINTSDHLYGLDGSLSYWHEDSDDDGEVDSSEKAYLYFGMRRGGDQYFALDISDPSKPELAWRIDAGTTGFSTLGQTWSRPIVTTITLNGTRDKKVIIFGGGYDVTQDGKSLRSTDSVGNGIYIVDAQTGSLLWSVGSDVTHTTVSSNMLYSIPSDLTVIDSDADRQADRIYFGDMGGQVWRIDLPNSGSPDILRLADFATNAETNAANFRRFYTPPSVALVREGGDLHYAVALGSGYRAHPLAQGVDDRFYMIKDTNLQSDGSASSNWFKLSESSLYDTTLNLINEGTAGASGTKAAAISALESANGWYLKLTGNNEKALSPSLIFNNQLAFSTYTPASASLSCDAPAGSGKLYLVNLSNATPAKDMIADNNLKVEDRSTSLPGVGIPSAPTPYFPAGEGNVDIYIGKQKAMNIENPIHRINWKVIE